MRQLICALLMTLLAACASQDTASPPRSEGFNAVEAAKTRVSLGLTYLKNGNYSQAKANLDKAMEFAPRLGDVHFAMAWYYQQVSEWEVAREYYEQALKLDRNNADLVNSYGAFLCEVGEYRDAKEYLLKAANSHQYNRSAETYENLAICSHREFKLDEAMTYLRTALKHQPGRARSWYMLVELLIASQQWQEAKIAYRQYEKVVPVTADTLKLAIEIENGLGNLNIAQGYQDMLARLYPEDIDQPRTIILSRKNVEESPPISLATEIVGQANVLTHVLQRGETLYQISRRYKVRVQSLVDWNNIIDVSNLSVGQKIIVSNPN